ncbi:MAG TPA: hypothetical protein DDX98_10670 [Bacteroidales bacterium]|nr:hypothetical protein [Bacteroidales bacterium]
MSKGKILIVDDEMVGRQLLQALLIVEGYEPFLAKSGREALELVNQVYPDLILMDIMMPDMNGYQTIKELKKDNKLKKTPVVIISALDDRDSKSRGLNVGASDFISKPYESEKVLTIIKEHLPDHLK